VLLSKELCANPRMYQPIGRGALHCAAFKRVMCKSMNVSTNRKRGIALCCFQKSLANSKSIGVKRGRTNPFNIY
jgi:hypothetical protein